MGKLAVWMCSLCLHQQPQWLEHSVQLVFLYAAVQAACFIRSAYKLKFASWLGSFPNTASFFPIKLTLAIHLALGGRFVVHVDLNLPDFSKYKELTDSKIEIYIPVKYIPVFAEGIEALADKVLIISPFLSPHLGPLAPMNAKLSSEAQHKYKTNTVWQPM